MLVVSWYVTPPPGAVARINALYAAETARLAAMGGLSSFNSSAATSAAQPNSNQGIYGALGTAAGNIFNPQTNNSTLSQLLAGLGKRGTAGFDPNTAKMVG